MYGASDRLSHHLALALLMGLVAVLLFSVALAQPWALHIDVGGRLDSRSARVGGLVGAAAIVGVGAILVREQSAGRLFLTIYSARLALALNFLLLLGAVLLVGSRRRRSAAPAADQTAFGLLLVAWCGVYPLFAMFDHYVPIVEKHALHLLPAIALFAALALGRALRYRCGRIVATVALTLIFWNGLTAQLAWIVVQYAQEK